MPQSFLQTRELILRGSSLTGRSVKSTTERLEPETHRCIATWPYVSPALLFVVWRRACKVYTKVGGRWLFLFQTGLFEYQHRQGLSWAGRPSAPGRASL